MKRILIFAFALIAIARAEDPLQKPILAPEETATAPAKSLRVVLKQDEQHEPSDKFTSDLPKIRAFWQGQHLKAGDRIEVAWLAADVGIAPKFTEITRGAVTTYKPNEQGVFALARPPDGWPLGKYRCDIYFNGKVAISLDFTIEKGPDVEVH